MLNIRFIFKMLGLMFFLETFFMLLAFGVAFLYGGDDMLPILVSCAVMLGIGLIFYLIGFRADEYSAGRREGMLTVALTWALFSLVGMLPFYLGGYIDNVTDAYFETMSGFTTTGATIFSEVESLPKGILFWRSLLQWQGGIGMIVFTVALMPIFGGGASQLFNAETTSITHERLRPRVTQTAKHLSVVYLFLTAIVIGLLWLGPMNLFDAVCHGLTTISTGGYSTKNTSVGFFGSAYVEYVITIFMFVGSTNIILIYFLLNGQPKKLFKDEEFRWFFVFVSIVVVILTAWLYFNSYANGVEESFRKTVFHVVSLISTTGFVTDEYLSWGAFFWLVALILMFVCGCAGSTSGGLKMGRFVILSKNLSGEFMKQIHPKAIIPVRMNGHIVSTDIVQRVLAFVFAYLALIVAGCIVLTLEGMPFDVAIQASLSAISNVGPGAGDMGSSSNFAGIPDISKWFLSLLMLTGRLEIFTVLTILLPGFWKQ